MASKSNVPYSLRAKHHSNPVVKKLFEIAETKKTNVIFSADQRTTADLLAFAESMSLIILPSIGVNVLRS